MRIFGYDIGIRKAPAKKNKLIENLLWPNFLSIDGLVPEDNYAAFMSAYRGWVYVAASKNSTSTASVPLRLYVGNPSSNTVKSHPTKKILRKDEARIKEKSSTSSLPQVRKAVEIVEVLDHPMIGLMRNVNNFMNYFTLFEMTTLFQELCGNAYWYILEDRLGVPKEIWPMPPQNVRILPDKEKFIRGYKFIQGFKRQEFPEQDVIHFKYPSPTSLFYGRGPLAAVTDSYNISQSINKYEQFVFGNMGRLEGAFETEAELSKWEFDRLKEEIRQTFQGIENVGKSPLLEKGVKYKAYGLAPKDLNFMQGRKAVKEEIVNAYGQSMGLYDKDATRANAEVASYTFMRDTITPRLIRMEEKINEKLTYRFDDKLFVSFDDPVPLDKAHRLKERESNLKTGYSSINIERETDNKESVEWGDIPILNKNLIPLGSGEDTEGGDEGPVSEILAMGIDKFSENLANEVVKRLPRRLDA